MAETSALKESLRAQFVGKSLHDVDTPAVVLDLAKVEANCNLMLDAVKKLGLGWRAHIKTHKTTELTRLQVGDKSTSPANVIVSTVLEAENIVPLLKEYREAGRKVNVLYAFPLLGSAVARLSRVSAQLGPGGLSVLVDHADQLEPHVLPALAAAGADHHHRPQVFLKVDMGSHRAGVPPGAPECARLVDALLRAEAAGVCDLVGLYCHAGHSYATRREWEALGLLGEELATLQGVARMVKERRSTSAVVVERPLVLSVGATPTATSIQHPDFSGDENDDGTGDASPDVRVRVPETLKTLVRDLKADGFALEVHAGVYPVLDLQQLATHSRDAARHLTADAIAITILADVASVYGDRGPGSQAGEALINAGTLALGREPCQDGKEYSGWGYVSPWNSSGSAAPGPGFPSPSPSPSENGVGVGGGSWQVGKVSQEHGILRWVGGDDGGATEGGRKVVGAVSPLRVGQRVRIWPNHACVAAALYGWYLVVDSRHAGREEEVVDVWPRWRGW